MGGLMNREIKMDLVMESKMKEHVNRFGNGCRWMVLQGLASGVLDPSVRVE
jgi:hypothetical protein